jgi:hypothetical protein
MLFAVLIPCVVFSYCVPVGWLFQAPPIFTKMKLIKTKDLDEDWGQPRLLPMPCSSVECVLTRLFAVFVSLTLFSVVVAQKRWLLWGYLLFGVFLPGFLGRWVLPDASFAMGALWIGVVGRFISWHCIWLINSFSHWEGYREFALASTAVYNGVLQFLQNGEGHHNRHQSVTV